MSQKDRRHKRIHGIIDEAAKALAAEGVQYFIGAVDPQPKEPDGGKAFASSEIVGENMCHIIDMAFPTREGLKNLGIWVGSVILSREQQLRRNGKN